MSVPSTALLALLPCPFCGFEDDEPTCHDKSGTPYCPNCGAVGPCNPEAWGENGDDIADNHDVLWNRRANRGICLSREAGKKEGRGMSDTPLTDKLTAGCSFGPFVEALAEHARKMEKERDSARKALKEAILEIRQFGAFQTEIPRWELELAEAGKE